MSTKNGFFDFIEVITDPLPHFHHIRPTLKKPLFTTLWLWKTLFRDKSWPIGTLGLPKYFQDVDHESISLTTLKVGVGGGDSASYSIVTSYQQAPESSSFPDNSMDTHAGSLDRPPEPAADGDQVQRKEKTRKCCVIQ